MSVAKQSDKPVVSAQSLKALPPQNTLTASFRQRPFVWDKVLTHKTVEMLNVFHMAFY